MENMPRFRVTYQDTRDYVARLNRTQVMELLARAFPGLNVSTYTDDALASLLNSAVKAGDDDSLELREAIYPLAEETNAELHNFRAAI
ncbi:hypothetical protein [Mycobacteroides abscessus]|uniref:hypothetical protein n=1 Tax=Mycobacteroides abscessus TaxID=36809 RepID=UPI000C25DBF4|nr:hypothetical protein [Mycobacteroides abscessus]